ncbi:uncharacterized protein YcbK (DUF882 family) [Sphaerotilus hippei]|uniref:Murein endopeptidase K n=1 Tax=Sphaerotilus hippei TaxID=744406 RepID=A0A318HHA6_9BURK|nr:DUF882 domain-containing protein [Sphaerotilus hippei]PXW99443.1 uncharacterized protein YcbK (DUF882 family) [Sphaerotilus hippei]
MTDTRTGSRRRFLHHTARLATLGALPTLAAHARASIPEARSLVMAHTHTHERIDLVYASGERYLPEALGTLNRFLRDHYSGEVGRIDPTVFDLMHRVQQVLGHAGTFQIISAYRSPATNEQLRGSRGGGVARHSLHMDGRAIDVRLPGVPLAELREAALSLKAGGVGYYPREAFVHLDTGRVRSW